MRIKGPSTVIYYQVETARGVHESMCMSLREARALAKILRETGVPGIQISRYDRSDHSDYYEVVEVIS